VLNRLELDNPIADFTTLVLEAVYRVPGVRLILGLAAPEWRPLWALTWVVAIVYLTLRIIESAHRVVLQRQMASQVNSRASIVARPIELTPVRSEMVDPAADVLATGDEDSDATDAPRPKSSRGRGVGGRGGRDTMAIRAALITGLLGCGILLIGMIAGRNEAVEQPLDGVAAWPGAMAPAGGSTDPDLTDGSTPEPPFAFAARSWRSVGGACVATLEVTAGSAAPRTLTMYVMDSSGAILAKDQMHVASLTPKAFHEFRFPGVDCGAVTEWQVQAVLRPQ